MHAWLEVDLDAVKRNVRLVKQHIGPQTGIVAVVKADAYGHGVEAIARTLDQQDIASFAVITLEEAQRVRSVSTKDVLIMGFLDDVEIEQAIAEGFVLSLYDRPLADLFQSVAERLGTFARVQIKVETGLNRLGLSVDETTEVLANPQVFNRLKVESIYTHLAQSGNRELDFKQYKIFAPVLEFAERLGLPVGRHMANSHALGPFPEGFLDFVRLGLALYGVEEVIPGLEPSLQAKTVVIQKKKLKPGDGVSYNHLFVADKEMEVAVIAMGYAEGLSQALTGKARVLIHGESRPIIGQICMNLCSIDVTGLEVRRGDEVVVIGKQNDQVIRVADMARDAGLRHHEIITRLGKSLPKIYFESGTSQESDDKSSLIPSSK